MKIITRWIVIIWIMVQSYINCIAQVSTGFNFGIVSDYVGWNAGQPFPLTIQHLGIQPINFLTDNQQRMTILGANGFVGMLNNNPVFNLTIGTQSTSGSGPFSDGGILAIGHSGQGALLPNGLTDDRFIWYPRLGAIRAGRSFPVVSGLRADACAMGGPDTCLSAR